MADGVEWRPDPDPARADEDRSESDEVLEDVRENGRGRPDHIPQLHRALAAAAADLDAMEDRISALFGELDEAAARPVRVVRPTRPPRDESVTTAPVTTGSAEPTVEPTLEPVVEATVEPVEEVMVEPVVELAAGPATVDDDDDLIELFAEGDIGTAEEDSTEEDSTEMAGLEEREQWDGRERRSGRDRRSSEIHEVVVADRMTIISQYEDDLGGAFSDLDAELVAEDPEETRRAKRRMFGRHAKGRRPLSDAG